MCSKLTLFVILAIGISLAGFALETTQFATDFTPAIYLWFTLAIMMSRGLAIVKKIGLPIVTSEILAGIVLGNLHFFGIYTFTGMENNEIVRFLAEIGAMILMFEIGLQTQLEDITSKLTSGLKIALFGTVLTFVGGYFITDLFYPQSSNGTKILLGLISAATATGISGKVFKDLKILNTVEVKTVLTASLIDEVLSILCFAVLSGVLISGKISLNQLMISATKTTGFFFLSITLGSRLTPLLTRYSIKIHAGISMKIGVLFMICTFYTWLAAELGLAPVIGAFIAGLIINPEYFKNFSQAKFLRDFKSIADHTSDENARNQIIKTVTMYEIRSLDELIKPLSNIFVPFFFTYIGLIFHLDDLLDISVILVALALISVTLLGRIISGYSEHSHLNKFVIGLGMTPIGEAGLIFTITGSQLGLISDELISSIVLALVSITILAPVMLKFVVHKYGVKHIY